MCRALSVQDIFKDTKQLCTSANQEIFLKMALKKAYAEGVKHALESISIKFSANRNDHHEYKNGVADAVAKIRKDIEMAQAQLLKELV